MTSPGPDAVLALALVHHLAISNNAPYFTVEDSFAIMGSQRMLYLMRRVQR